MNTKINERKNIIVSFKANVSLPKGIDKRIQSLRGLTIINALIALPCICIVISTILLEPLGIEVFKWDKMGLLVIFSVSFSLGLPEYFYELKLLNHLKKINKASDFEGLEALNSELKMIIKVLNNKLKNYKYLIPLVLVIFIFGLLQIFSDTLNPYWGYLKIPVLLFYGISISRFVLTYPKINKNIRAAEKSL